MLECGNAAALTKLQKNEMEERTISLNTGCFPGSGLACNSPWGHRQSLSLLSTNTIQPALKPAARRRECFHDTPAETKETYVISYKKKPHDITNVLSLLGYHENKRTSGGSL